MPEYDAFGREIGEDTLADTGWSTSSGQTGSPLPPPPPVPSGSPLPPPPPPPSAFDAGSASPFPPPPPPSAVQQAAEAGFRDFAPQPVVRQRKGMGCGLVGLVIATAVVGSIAWAVIALVGAVEDGVDSARDFIPSIPTVTTPGSAGGGAEEPDTEAPAPPEEPPVGLRKGSMIRRAEFATAMRQLRAAKLGNLRTLRVAPDRIDVQLLTKGGALRDAQLTPGGGLQKFGSPTPGFGHLDTLPYSVVSSAAPERLVRSAAKRLGKSADRVNYLVLLDFGGTPQWSVFFKAGEQFQADRAGKIFRRVN